MELDYDCVGRRIRKYRMRRGMTQKGLAESAAISTSHIERIEQGGSIPRPKNLLKLCNALEVTPDILLQGLDKSSYVHSIVQQLELIRPEAFESTVTHLNTICNFLHGE